MHHRQLVGLDLKPAHIFRTSQGWKLIDLDLARSDRSPGGCEPRGTLHYASPESLLEGDDSVVSDLYSLGASLFEALTGNAPFSPVAPANSSFDSVQQFAEWLKTSPLPSFPNALVANAPILCDCLSALLSRDPTQRRVSAEAALLRLLGNDVLRWRMRCPMPEAAWIQSPTEFNEIRAWEARAASRGGVMLLAGPTGSGRRRGLNEILHLWQKEGQLVIQLSRLDKSSCWQQLLRILIQLRAGTAMLMPQLEHEDLSLPSADLWSSLHARDQFEQLAARIIGSLRHEACKVFQTLGHPVRVVLDFQMFDALGLAVFDRLLPNLENSGLLLINNAPAEELPQTSSSIAVTPLLPLRSAEVRRFCEDIFGPGIFSREELEILEQRCAGNPGRLRDLLQDRWLLPAGTPPTDALEIPNMLDSLFHLDAPSRQILSLLSCDENPIHQSQLEAFLGYEARPSLQILLNNALVEIDALRQISLSPSGRRLQKNLHSDPNDRRRAHQKWAFYLARSRSRGESIAAWRIAQHYEAAGDAEHATLYLYEALREATERHTQRRVAILKALLSLTDPRLNGERLELELLLAEQLIASRQYLECLDHLTPVLGACQPESPAVPSSTSPGPTPPEAQMPQYVDPISQVRALALRGIALMSLGQYAEAHSELKAALKMPVQHSRTSDRRFWYQRLAWIEFQLENPKQAETALRAAWQEFGPVAVKYASGIEALQSRKVELNERTLLEQIWLELELDLRPSGPTPDAESRIRGLHQAAKSLGFYRIETASLNLLSDYYRQSNRIDAAIETPLHLIELAEAYVEPIREATARNNLGLMSDY